MLYWRVKLSFELDRTGVYAGLLSSFKCAHGCRVVGKITWVEEKMTCYFTFLDLPGSTLEVIPIPGKALSDANKSVIAYLSSNHTPGPA